MSRFNRQITTTDQDGTLPEILRELADTVEAQSGGDRDHTFNSVSIHRTFQYDRDSFKVEIECSFYSPEPGYGGDGDARD